MENVLKIRNWFSNMTLMDKPFEYDGAAYKTSENFYQAMKVIDPQLRREIAAMRPYESKFCFKEEPDRYIIRKDWNDDLRLKTMRYILDFKFDVGTSWHDKLMETVGSEIVEVNDWRDTFWGYDINLQRGQNHLGKMLMKIRDNFAKPLDVFIK